MAPAAAMIPTKLRIERILVPIDFSEHSRAALKYAFAFAEQFGAEIILTHIVEPIVYPTDWMYPLVTSDFSEDRKFLLQKIKALAGFHDVKTQAIVRLGRAWQEIVRVATENRADLIVIATHGYSGVKHALLGSVAEKIVRHAPCPVLTVRPEEQDFVQS
jgi:universal stress protein A